MARLLCLDVEQRKLIEVECNDLQDYYNALGCDCFDIARIYIGSKKFDCFVDDNGLLKENPIPSAVSKSKEVLLVGNIIFANHDDEGNTTSLTDEDIAIIKRNMALLVKGNNECVLLAVIGSYFNDRDS